MEGAGRKRLHRDPSSVGMTVRKSIGGIKGDGGGKGLHRDPSCVGMTKRSIAEENGAEDGTGTPRIPPSSE